MRCLKRNLTPFWFALYDGKQPILDDDGFETGESIVCYTLPKKAMANISPATGSAQIEQFGTSETYDKVIVTDDLCLPIDENSVLYVDKCPFDKDGNVVSHDYIVKRVAKSRNFVSYAIKKVD